MKTAVLLATLAYLHVASGALHTLQYFYTASSGISNFPEFVDVGVVDGVAVSRYDSDTKKKVPLQRWMAENLDQDYWESSANWVKGTEQAFKANIEILRQRFNQTGGIHTFQYMYGCEWDDETQQKNGFRQFGYDGEDFIAYDIKTFRWIAPAQQAMVTQRKWNNDQAQLEYEKNYITQQCVEWLQKYLKYGQASVQSKVSRPKGSLLQKSSSGLACHATGFYPDSVMITWKKDGQEMHDDMDVGETLPNDDGTFQKRVVLNVSPEERKKDKYSCEITHKSGEPIIMIFEEGNNNLPAIVGGCVFAAVVVIVAVVAFLMKKKKDYNKAPQSDTSSDNSEPAKA